MFITVIRRQGKKTKDHGLMVGHSLLGKMEEVTWCRSSGGPKGRQLAHLLVIAFGRTKRPRRDLACL